MDAHTREGMLAGMLPEATAKFLKALPRTMALDALQALIPPIAQQVLLLRLALGQALAHACMFHLLCVQPLFLHAGQQHLPAKFILKT